MSDFFISQKSGLTKEQSKRLVDPVLYSDPNPNLYIIVVKRYSLRNIKTLVRIIKSYVSGNTKVCVLFGLTFLAEEKEIKKNVSDFFDKHTIDLKKYIPENSKILTFGRAIYCITKDTDIQASSFYDFSWNKTSFYSLDFKSLIYPVDSLHAIFNFDLSLPMLDCFEKKFFNYQLLEINKDIATENYRKPKIEKIFIADPNSFLKQNVGKGIWSLDIETSSTDWKIAEIGCITLSNNGYRGYFLPWSKIDHDLLSEFLKDKKLICANGTYDFKVLARNGIKNLYLYYDTMHAGHCLNEFRSNSLKSHSWYWTKYGGYDLPLERYKRIHHIRNYLDIPHEILFDYAVMDAIVTYQVYKKTEELLAEDPELERYFWEDRMSLVRLFIDISMRGVYIDWEKVKKIGLDLQKDIKDLKEEIWGKFGQRINIDSGPNLGKFIEFELGWPAIKRVKASIGGYYAVNAYTLNEWKKLGYEESDLISQYNSLRTIYDTFIGDEKLKTGIWQYKQQDGKIYPEFWVSMALSHRFKSSSPNWQNCPSHGDIAKIIRSIYTVPGEDYDFCEIDFAGLQLRICAAMSMDEAMRKAFTEMGGDLHSLTAYNIFYRGVKKIVAEWEGGRKDYLSKKKIRIRRNSQDIEIFARDLKHKDILYLRGKESLPLIKVLHKDFLLSDFIRKKSKPVYKDYRYKAKGVNFGLIFNQSARSFGLGTLKKEWNLEMCDTFIEEQCLLSELSRLIEKESKKKKSVRLKEEDCKYVICATQIKKEFFDLYAGVKKWIYNSIKKGKTDGFIRSHFGNRRLVPQLLSEGEDDSYGTIKNLSNICCNSPVQSHEVVLIGRAIRLIDKFIQENNLKSYVTGMVHDSVTMYLHKSEREILCRQILKIFSIDYPENKGIPMEAEIKIADISLGEVWGGGSITVKSSNVDSVFGSAA